jgi:hypothetical protein
VTDNTELQCLMRLRRLARQITASLPVHPDCEQTFQVHGSMRELPEVPRQMCKPTGSKAALLAELDVTLANYHGPVTLCAPAPAPEPDRGQELESGW